MNAITGLQPINTSLNVLGTENIKPKNNDAISSFKEIFTDAINNVNGLQNEADNMKVKLATGEVNDIHSVMIASEKASLALQLTVQIRNKLVDAYQEIMRMQV
jgi:flagellar hook-basal body complex protein FliE